MSEGLDFGALRKDRMGTDAPQRAPAGTATVSQSVKKPTRNRTDWKKKYEQLKDTAEKELRALRKSHAETFNELTELKTWAEAVKKNETQMHELQDEIHRLKVQDAMSKKVIDKLTLEAEKYKFKPESYSKIAQLLVSMRVRGNRAQKETVINIVGSTDIVEVRKYIFDLLEAPYNE